MEMFEKLLHVPSREECVQQDRQQYFLGSLLNEMTARVEEAAIRSGRFAESDLRSSYPTFKVRELMREVVAKRTGRLFP